MTLRNEEPLHLSGLQHFAFCRRQWALIHIEHQWRENWRTADGQAFHSRAHDEGIREHRGDMLIIRGLSVASHALGVSGKCDLVEFHKDAGGIPLHGEEGAWLPYPVEYKRGTPKVNQGDALQLCAQAMCLEEMLCCPIGEGALYYGETRRRCAVVFDDELRRTVKMMLEEMHRLYCRGYTPKVTPSKSCNACSLKELCLPFILRKDRTVRYLKEALEKEP